MAGLPNYFDIQTRVLKNKAKAAYEKQKKKFKGIAARQQAPESQFIAENLRAFYYGGNKTLQKNFRFDVEFYYKDYPLSMWMGEIPQIEPWHVQKISFPSSNKFTLNPIKIGPYPYCFPTMDSSGYDFDITFEEDDIGTVYDFIQFLQNIIIGGKTNGVVGDTPYTETSNGNYSSQADNRLSKILINTYNDTGDIVKTVSFFNCFFLGASQVDLDYAGNESIKYTVNFHSDVMSNKAGNKIIADSDK